MLIPHPSLPAPLRVLNRVGASLEHVGVSIGAMRVETVLAAAQKRTGLSDFGPDGPWREGLEVYVASLAETPLHTGGRLYMRDSVTRNLVNRLRFQQARRDIAALEHPPLLVCGLPRSGTTFLHRMLCEAEKTRALPLWELMEPIWGPDSSDRLAAARKRMTRLSRYAPNNMDAMHLMRAELPDECGYLLKSSFRASILWLAPALQWLDWYLQAPMDDAYEDWRDWLRVLQRPGHRFVLKDPFHAGSLEALFSAIPDAMVVRTHRDPLETVPSYHKLTTSLHSVVCETLEMPAIVEANTRWLEAIAHAMVDPGPGVPAERVFDVDYQSLISDPVGTVRDIHAYFNLPFPDALRQTLNGYLRQNMQRKFGEKPYSIQAFDQTREALERRFGAYRERFSLARAAM